MTPNHITVRTFTVTGVDACPATIEVAVSQSLPSFTVIGLGDRIERETRERVTAAIANCGYEMPRGRIVVNVAPAHIRRIGGGYSLPIACAILAATDQVRADPLRAWAPWGDLELTGELRGARGSIAVAEAAARIGLDGLVVAADNEGAARLASGIAVHGARTLRDVAQLLGGRAPVDDRELEQPGIADIRGNAAAIRAAIVAAAGGHHLLLTGPAGAGRTMLARRIPGILPPIGAADALEVARIHEIAGNLDGHRLPTARPLRTPHHSVSTSGLIGGGAVPAPGEISLAHRGVVYLHDVDQFSRSAMAALTSAVRDREVLMHRGERCTVLPCDALLVASVGDCPCGRAGDNCGCGQSDLERWRRGVLERAGDVVQIAAALRSPSAEELAAPAASTSFDARMLVAVARERQAERAAATGTTVNGRLPTPVRAQHVACEDTSALASLDQPARDRALRVARTIADLADCSAVSHEHLQEAVALTDVAGTLCAARRRVA